MPVNFSFLGISEHSEIGIYNILEIQLVVMLVERLVGLLHNIRNHF